MPDILIRNIDSAVAKALKDRARKHGRSLQAELKLLLNEAAEREVRMERFREVQERVSDDTRHRPQTSSTILLREDRDR
jgi:antitoxin FitA